MRAFPLVFSSLLLFSAAFSGQVSAQQAGSADSAVVTDLVRKFYDAQINHDPDVLRAITSEQYVEISPLGDVDPRERMIGFYVKDPARVPSPATVDERTVRVFGDSAMVTMKVTLTINGQPRSMRSSYLAHKEGAEWKIISAQHTPIRPAKS
jgi:ketosteroid isomerase-like protein